MSQIWCRSCRLRYPLRFTCLAATAKVLCLGFCFWLLTFLATTSVVGQDRERGSSDSDASSSSKIHPEGFDVPMSPIGTVFHRVQVSSLADSGISLQFRYIPENVRIPIDRLRFLAIKEVQEELQLSKKAVERLKPVLEMFETFELEDRWESNFMYGKVIVHSVRESAIENVKRFSDQLAVIEGGEFLTTKQLLRLEQIRLRFRCLGLESTDYPLPGKSIREKLGLTPAQETAIREIVETELGDVLKLGTQIDDIGRVLSADQREILHSCFKPLLEHKTLDALSLAQCQDELMQQPTPDSKEADWPPILVQRAVLTLFGQLAPDNVYLERGAFTAPFPWRRIISQIESGGLEWLEFSDAQREELLGLKHSEDGSVQYYGRDVYVSMMGDYKPEADWTLEQLKRWKDRFREACTSSDEKLGDRIKEILLPRQLDLFRSAVIIQRITDLGPYYLVLKCKFAGLEIAADDLNKIEELRSERLAKLRATFKRIEARVQRELTPEQRDWAERHFGAYCSLYPSVWLFLVP